MTTELGVMSVGRPGSMALHLYRSKIADNEYFVFAPSVPIAQVMLRTVLLNEGVDLQPSAILIHEFKDPRPVCAIVVKSPHANEKETDEFFNRNVVLGFEL